MSITQIIVLCVVVLGITVFGVFAKLFYDKYHGTATWTEAHSLAVSFVAYLSALLAENPGLKTNLDAVYENFVTYLTSVLPLSAPEILFLFKLIASDLASMLGVDISALLSAASSASEKQAEAWPWRRVRTGHDVDERLFE